MKGLRQPMGSLGQLLSRQEQEGVPWAQETSRPARSARRDCPVTPTTAMGNYVSCILGALLYFLVDGYDINNMRINYYFLFPIFFLKRINLLSIPSPLTRQTVSGGPAPPALATDGKGANPGSIADHLPLRAIPKPCVPQFPLCQWVY